MANVRTNNWTYFPTDTKNMSYDETAFHLYGVEIDEKNHKSWKQLK